MQPLTQQSIVDGIYDLHVEAQPLHLIDMMDSRFNMFREATKGLGEGELSEKVWALGGRVCK